MRYKDFANSPARQLLNIVSEVFLLVQFQVLQDRCLDIDREAPALLRPFRDPSEPHFPAMEVAVEVDRGEGKLSVGKIPAGTQCDLPFRCDVQLPIEAQGLS